jgi:hypothetical protein
VLDEIIQLRGLAVLVDDGLVEADEVVAGMGLELGVLMGLGLGVGEGAVEFVFASEEELFAFIERGHILHMRSNCHSLRVCSTYISNIYPSRPSRFTISNSQIYKA